MRSMLFVVFASLAACATSSSSSGQRPINVHAVRMEIKSRIDAEPASARRKIVSVGKVRQDLAVVYTERDGEPRQEETWVRDANGWKLSGAVAVRGQ